MYIIILGLMLTFGVCYVVQTFKPTFEEMQNDVLVYCSNNFEIVTDYFSYGVPAEGRKLVKTEWKVVNNAEKNIVYLHPVDKLYENGVYICCYDGLEVYELPANSTISMSVIFTIESVCNENDIANIFQKEKYDYSFYFEDSDLEFINQAKTMLD